MSNEPTKEQLRELCEDCFKQYPAYTSAYKVARYALSRLKEAPVVQEDELLSDIDAAINRITSGQSPMRIPADKTDPDWVLSRCAHYIRSNSTKDWVSMGVGNGAGQLFVHGSYEAIKILQAKLCAPTPNLQQAVDAAYERAAQIIERFWHECQAETIDELAAKVRTLKSQPTLHKTDSVNSALHNTAGVEKEKAEELHQRAVEIVTRWVNWIEDVSQDMECEPGSREQLNADNNAVLRALRLSRQSSGEGK